jgi:hypothetical protein
MLRPLYPRGKSPRYTLDRRLGVSQSRSGRCGKYKNLALPGIEPVPSRSQPVAIPTELSRLLNRYVRQVNAVPSAKGSSNSTSRRVACEWRSYPPPPHWVESYTEFHKFSWKTKLIWNLISLCKHKRQSFCDVNLYIEQYLQRRV